MARLSNYTGGDSAVDVKQPHAGGYQLTTNTPAWKLTKGGQQAWAPNIEEWLSNQAYVSRPVVCKVLQTPRIFEFLTGGQAYATGLRSVMETHSTTITGLDQTLSADFEGHGVGGSGAIQEEVTDVTRAQATPSHTFVDKYGRPIQRLHDIWMRFGMMDPDTKHPLAALIRNDDRLTDMGPDMYTMTCLYFEPDPLWQYVDKAWLCVNMMPRTGGEVTAQRDLRSAQQLSNLSYEYTSLSYVGFGVNRLADKVMKNMAMGNADPYMRRAHLTDNEGAEIKDKEGNSYQDILKTLKSQQVDSWINPRSA